MIRFATSDERGEIVSEQLVKPLRLAAAALLTAFLAGCSINVPLPSMMSNETTGSIKARTTPFAGDLDETDWRIAEPHLAEALKSASGDAPRQWANPASGRAGAFQSVAGAFRRDGQTCRAFLARINVSGSTKTLQGVGCLMAGDAVFVEETQPWKAL